MPDLYHACDAFVLASHDEGLSNAFMEALASGLPSVATRVGGHADAVRDGEEALLVPPRDVPALTAALRTVMTDPKRASRLAQRAPEVAVRLGTPTENTHRLLRILEDAAARGRARRGA
jgi:glycosyltransferase involved in cell wall biosynthesis